MIEGKITGLRAVEKEDLVMLRDWRNIASFRKNFREFRELNMYHQEKWFENVMNRNNDFMFVILDIHENKPIGAAGLLYIDWIIRSADFSFYIGEEKKYIDDDGYAKDAAYTLMDYGFNILNLNKIWMELYEFDNKKLKFFKNIFNYKVDGKLRKNCYYDGKYWNSYILSLLKKEFNNINLT